jgi:hypothetical protein
MSVALQGSYNSAKIISLPTHLSTSLVSKVAVLLLSATALSRF